MWQHLAGLQLSSLGWGTLCAGAAVRALRSDWLQLVCSVSSLPFSVVLQLTRAGLGAGLVQSEVAFFLQVASAVGAVGQATKLLFSSQSARGWAPLRACTCGLTSSGSANSSWLGSKHPACAGGGLFA